MLRKFFVSLIASTCALVSVTNAQIENDAASKEQPEPAGSVTKVEDATDDATKDAARKDVYVFEEGDKLCAAVAKHYGIVIRRNDFSTCFRVSSFCKMVRVHNRLRPRRPIPAGTEVKMPPFVRIFEEMGLDEPRMDLVRQAFRAHDSYYSIGFETAPFIYQERTGNLIKNYGEKLEEIVPILRTLEESLPDDGVKRKPPKVAIREFGKAASAMETIIKHSRGENVFIEYPLLTINRRFAYGMDHLHRWALRNAGVKNWKDFAVGYGARGESCAPSRGD